MQALPRQSTGGGAVGTGLPSTPGTLGPSPGVPGLPRSIHLHIHTIDPGTLIAVPSSSLSPPPRPSSFEEHVRVPAGGFTVRQLLERADARNASHTGPAPNDSSGPARPNHSSTDTADGANSGQGSLPAGPTGMQGALMTFDENGAMRVVPVRSRGAVHPPSGHLHVPSGHIHVDPLLSRFQHQFNFRTASNLPNDTPVPAAMYPLPSASTDSPRHMDQANRSLPGMNFHSLALLGFCAVEILCYML